MDQVYVYLPFTLRQVVPIMLGIRSFNEPIKERSEAKLYSPLLKFVSFFGQRLKKNYEFDAYSSY